MAKRRVAWPSSELDLGGWLGQIAARLFLQNIMSLTSVKQLKTVKKNVRKHVDAALEKTGGLLRLAPAWVPRSFLQPGLRLKLHPDATYA